MDIEKLLKLGTQIGLSGDELRVWTEQRMQEHREEKEKEREERERQRQENDKEREERERQRQENEKERVAVAEQARLEQEKIRDQAALIEKQLELERLKLENPITQPQESANSRGVGVKAPRLPPFDDKVDQIDSYLLRFERYASVNKWNNEDWGTHLAALLRGVSLDVHSRMDEDEAKDYQKVKEALLRRYNLTEEGYQERFRKARPEPTERMNQFRVRVQTYLDKWIALSGKRKDSALDLVDLLMMEQLLNCCNRELQVFLKERKPKSTDELVELADKFVEAHGSAGAFSKGPTMQAGIGMPTVVKGQALQPKNGMTKIPHSPPQVKSSNNPHNSSSSIRCHRCGKTGHMMRDCRSRPQVSAMDMNRCGNCHKFGHAMENCWAKKRLGSVSKENQVETSHTEHQAKQAACGCKWPVVSSAACSGFVQSRTQMPTAKGSLDGVKVTVLRDSGSSCVVIRKGLGRRTAVTEKVPVSMANGTTELATLTKGFLESPYFTGEIDAVEMESPLYDVILGNIPGARCPGLVIDSPTSEGQENAMAVETRGSKGRKVKNLRTPSASDSDITVKELIELQLADPTLEACRKMATTGDERTTGRANTSRYGYENGILYRYYKSENYNNGEEARQVVVPKCLRETVMKMAHESIMAGHLAAKKTTERILNEFHWPNIWTDVNMFTRSCDQCQRSTAKGMTAKVPLSEVPLIDEPFSRVAVDIVGPIVPASESGNRYILTVVDYCTRYPEAVALKSIDTESVAEALVDIFSRMGVPKEILSDRGTQFTSELMKEICRLLSIRQLMTTPYHPQCNGLVERFNGTLKNMLKRLAADQPRQWDRFINAALFAYREAPQESLGFSPFELLFGRALRGPMTLLRELWTKEQLDEDVKTTYQYVCDLRDKLERTVKLAQENLKQASSRYKRHFDRKAKARSFQIGDKVLLLLPTKHNKLELKWQGPFEVVKKVAQNNYSVDLGGIRKTYHANLLKLYLTRKETGGTSNQEVGLLHCAVAAVVDEEEEESSDMEPRLETPSLVQTESAKDVQICVDLGESQKEQVRSLLLDYQDVMTDVPGHTDVYRYDIKLTSSDPIRRKPYPVPQALKETLREEVRTMLDAGIIEPSDSPYCSPSVVVKKKDGSNRYCVDYRGLNNITLFDAEPMPQLDDLFQQIGPECNFVSKIDLSKGYWQIPLGESSKPMTAFATELGLMQFTVLPFGLQCAPAAFSRLMRRVLDGMPNVKNYIDDIIIHHASWEEHLKGLKDVLDRLRQAGLTARPTKCLIGYSQVEFLGHRIGSGCLTPTIDKVQAIENAKRPENKKQMRSFLGLAGFYRRYVPNFAAMVSPLTDMTRKGMPTKIQWGEAQEKAFSYVKGALTKEPILRLPDFSKSFVLSTDASDTGIGAVLSQTHEDGQFPVMYISRKLLPREQRYSVVEKECLALVWAVKTLNTYLMGREFVVETDHAPLLYLNRAKSENGRLMRWALLLHQYRFTLKAVKGTDNHGPDCLSRLV